MEEKKLTEKESLELISRMIETTRGNIAETNGNVFLVYGYLAAFLSVLIFIAVALTGNGWWHMLWMAMFVPGIVRIAMGKSHRPEVVTYLDSTVSKIWMVCGILCGLTFIALPLIGYIAFNNVDFGMMLPLCLIYFCIGTSMTGLVIKEPYLTWMPLVGFIVSIYMLLGIESMQYAPWWNLCFGTVFIFGAIIPGHILNSKNRKTKKELTEK